jgi:excisionase family DNA binding protein
MSEMKAKRKRAKKKTTKLEKLAFNLSEAADTLGTSYQAVYRMVRGGQLRAVRAGRRIIIPRSALEEFLGEKGEAE